MATWQANETAYGPGGGEYVDDAGSIWPDPYGTLNTPPAPAAPGGFKLPPGLDASASPENTTPAPMGTPPAAPGAAAPGFAVADPAHPGIQTFQGSGPNMPPPPSPGIADKGGSAGSAAPPPQPGLADQQSSSSTHGSETGSTGLSAEAQQRQGANITAVAGAQAGAREAGAQYGTLQANQAADRSKLLLQQASEGIEKTAAQLAIQDEIQRRVDHRMTAGAEWKPDRSALFHNDHGVAFGLMAAVAAMAGGWMQGRGLAGQNPYLPTIFKMIDDNVSAQVRSNSATMQQLRDQKGDIKAAIVELKQRQLHFAQMRLDGLAMKDSSDLMRAGVEKTRQDMQAQDAKWEQEKRQALERTETRKVTSSFTQETKPNPNATAERTPEQGKAMAAVDAINDFGKKAGLTRDKNGKWTVGGGAFPPAMLERLNPFADDSIKASHEAAVEAYGRLQSGGVIGDKEREAFNEQLGGKTTTRAQLAARMNSAQVALDARLRSRDEVSNKARTTIPEAWKVNR